MKSFLWCACLFFLSGAFASVSAQNPIFPPDEVNFLADKRPLDDIVERTHLAEARIMPYAHVREADILWEKRIWRTIDVRQKKNEVFRGAEPLAGMLIEAVLSGELTAYSTIDDQFSSPLKREELEAMLSSRDTVEVVDPTTYEVTLKEVVNEWDPAEVIKFRLKEVWFFDSRYSTLRVRILGLAPVREVADDNGNKLYEQPLFWIYFPEARPLLARKRVFNPFNDAVVMSWDDLFEVRFFDSYITKENNSRDMRLEDYLSGRDLLLESENIRLEIFNREHDLWSY